MKKNEFTRTVVISTVRVATVTVSQGKVITEELSAISYTGTVKLTDEKAMKLAKETYTDKNPLVVLGIETKEEVRAISMDDFMKYSVKVERPASQQKKTV